jgi:uncharacterized membrane protein
MAYAEIIVGPGETLAQPVIRKIGMRDLFDALRRGVDDFMAMPSQLVFLCLIYPVVGLVLSRMAFGYDVLPILFPLMAGFALVGPLAAIGFYELSRRREQGLDTHWTHVFDVLHSRSLGAIVVMGLLLMGIFLGWLVAAKAIYQSQFGVLAPDSITGFVREVLTTPAGWNLIVIGNGVGFLFAAAVLTIGAVSFPLLLDREVGAAAAILTSIRAVMANPVPMAIWGLIVAALLLIGSLPFLFGLAVVLPVLGHATWHLYRRLVVR